MKCIVKDCTNHRHEGKFVGDLCSPCFTFLITGEGTYSQAYKSTVLKEREACAGLRKEVELRGKWPSDYADGFFYALEKYEDMIRARDNT